MRSVAIRRRLNGAMARSAAGLHVPRGCQSLSHHSSAVRTPSAARRCPTKLHSPKPATASPTATAPLTSDDTKMAFDSSAKRSWRVKITF